MRRTERQDLGNAKAARGPGQQNIRVGDQPIWQGVERCGGIIDIERTGPGQGGNAVAVAVQPEGLRRTGYAEHAGIVRDVGIDALGEIVQQRVIAAWRQHGRDHPCVRRVQRRVDRLEVVELRLVVEQQQGLGAEQRGTSCRGGHPAPASGDEAGTGRQRHEQQRHQEERVHHEHRSQHQRRPGARAGQVIAVDQADTVRVQHEAQTDEYAGEKEEWQQARVISGDVPDLRLPGRRILQLERIERVRRREVEADCRGGDQQRRQPRQQRFAMARKGVTEQRKDHAAEREAHHHDGDHPVAVFRPLCDGEVAG